MRMIVKNTDIFPIPKNPHMLHLGTIGYGLREFVCLICIAPGEHQGKTYIEEVVLNTVDWTSDVFANLKFIEDDNLAEDLARFAMEKKLLDQERVIGQLYETGRSSWIIGSAGGKR